MKLFADPACWEFKRKFPNEFKSYGCGPGGIGDFFVPDTVYGLSIREACQPHDWDYRHSPQSSSKHRKRCDKRFLNNALTIIDAGTKSKILKRLRYRRARFYYKMIRRFGARAYWSERDMDIITEV